MKDNYKKIETIMIQANIVKDSEVTIDYVEKLMT